MNLSKQMQKRITFDIPVDDETIGDWAKEVAELEATNAELLLEILGIIVEEQSTYGFHGPTKGMRLAREAIRKAKSHADTLKGE